MLDSGHSREAVLEYELPYMFAFIEKRAEVVAAQQPDSMPQSPQAARRRPGRSVKTTSKTMTDQEMLAKVQAQNRKG